MSVNLTGTKNIAWKGGKAKKMCEVCNREFSITQSLAAKGKGRFCSRECFKSGVSGENSILWTGGKVERACEICDKIFLANRSQVDIGKARFCSHECYNRWMSANWTGEDHPRWKGGEVKAVCEICGEAFTIEQGKANRGLGRFCSNECKGIGASGENGPGWQGGKSFEPYPSTFNNAFKQKIRERDGYTCAICGTLDSKSIHHINYIKDDTTPENCITLCRPCHGKTGGNRPHWQALLAKIMQDRGFADCKVSLLGIELHWVEEE